MPLDINLITLNHHHQPVSVMYVSRRIRIVQIQFQFNCVQRRCDTMIGWCSITNMAKWRMAVSQRWTKFLRFFFYWLCAIAIVNRGRRMNRKLIQNVNICRVEYLPRAQCTVHSSNNNNNGNKIIIINATVCTTTSVRHTNTYVHIYYNFSIISAAGIMRKTIDSRQV